MNLARHVHQINPSRRLRTVVTFVLDCAKTVHSINFLYVGTFASSEKCKQFLQYHYFLQQTFVTKIMTTIKIFLIFSLCSTSRRSTIFHFDKYVFSSKIKY